MTDQPAEPIVAAVAAALQTVADQCRCDADADLLREIAENVTMRRGSGTCPVCQQETCDEGCPLASIRGQGSVRPPG